MAQGKGQFISDPSSTGSDDFVENPNATPPARPLNSGEQAFQLATLNKQEIAKIREDINSPQWSKDLIKSQTSLNRVFKISLWMFLLMVLILFLSFALLSIFQVNILFNILEDIRSSNKMEIDDNLLNQFNQLFFYCRGMVTFLGSVIGAIGIAGLFIYVIIKVAEKITDNWKNKR